MGVVESERGAKDHSGNSCCLLLLAEPHGASPRSIIVQSARPTFKYILSTSNL